VLDFLCYFLVSRQESRRKKILAETMMTCSFILTPPFGHPSLLKGEGMGKRWPSHCCQKSHPYGVGRGKFFRVYPIKDTLI